MSSLKLFMLPGGTEVVGKVTPLSDNSHSFILEHPLVVRPVQKAPGQYVLDLFPYSVVDPEGQHQFLTSAVVSVSLNVPQMLADAYNERTSALILSGAVDAFAALSK